MAAVPPDRAYVDYIDFRVLALLFCLMAVVQGVQDCGFFSIISQRLLGGNRKLRGLVLLLVLLPFFSSMFITNDVALLTFVPFGLLILEMAEKREWQIFTVVMQTLAANLGSMATPVGNPQNLFLYSYYDLSPGQFFSVVLPLAGISFLAVSVCSLFVKGESVQVAFTQKEKIHSPAKLAMNGFLFLLCLLSVFRVFPYPVLTIVVFLCFLLFQRRILRKVDYSLLLTFVCFFVFAGNLGRIPR